MVCCVISLSNILRLAILVVLVVWFAAWWARTGPTWSAPMDGDVRAAFFRAMQEWPKLAAQVAAHDTGFLHGKEPERTGWLW